MTKSEMKILDLVTRDNERGILCGLGTDPQSPNYHSRKFRFIKRLAEAGKIVWAPWTPEKGAGWALPGKF